MCVKARGGGGGGGEGLHHHIFLFCKIKYKVGIATHQSILLWGVTFLLICFICRSMAYTGKQAVVSLSFKKTKADPANKIRPQIQIRVRGFY